MAKRKELFEADKHKIGHRVFKAIMESLKGEPVAFPIALDSVEVEWLYKQGRKLFEPKPDEQQKEEQMDSWIAKQSNRFLFLFGLRLMIQALRYPLYLLYWKLQRRKDR